MDDHYTLLGLAHPRTAWPALLSSLATNGGAPITYLSCLTGDEVRALLSSGPLVSAVLLDASSPHVDRDLIAAITSAGAAAIGIDSARSTPEWLNLGCQASLSDPFTKDELLATVKRHARPPSPAVGSRQSVLTTADLESMGALTAVFGPGGTGSTSMSMALCQGLAAANHHREEVRNEVVLVDGVRRGDMAMYHDIGDILPGLPELAAAYRTGTADPDDLRNLVHPVASRHYDVLLGLRRPSDWTILPCAATRSGINGLRRTYKEVVVEADHDLDSEQSTGSADVGARHFLSTEAARTADAICVVGLPTMKGLNDTANLFADLTSAGAEPRRIFVVLNRSPRSPASRSRLNSTLARLVAMDSVDQPAAVLHVAEIRSLEGIHRDAHRLPDQVCTALARSAWRISENHGPRRGSDVSPERVSPGDLGTSVGSGAEPDRRVA
jgi:hypothetical protein